MPEAKLASEIPDIQNNTDGFSKRKIYKVGIRNVDLPISILTKDGTLNHSSARISTYSSLDAESKGVNMSRFRILLEESFMNKGLNLKEAIRDAMQELKVRLGTDNAYIKVKFDYFTKKIAPVSKVPSHSVTKCILEGKLVDGVAKYFLTADVWYTSLCPCSKEISNYSAHNQPSIGTVTVELVEDKMCWIEDLIELVESCGSAPIINILKRNDEKWQTELMYENPVFVEDMVRRVADKLDILLDDSIKDYAFIANHYESIHQQVATSIITAGRKLT